MELEVYNEYAIVQHYSDLTDYISENIYILDKKNQSEIITENWGLIAIGAVVAVALVWGIILLVKHFQKGKEKDKKMKKTEKEVEQVEQAATQAVQRTNISDDDISKIGSFMAYAILKQTNLPTTTGSEEGTSNAVTKLNLTEIDLTTLANVSDRRGILKDISNTQKKYINSSNPLIKKLANMILMKDVEKYLKIQTNSLKYQISDKSSILVGKILRENPNIKNDISAAFKEDEDKYQNEGLANAEEIKAAQIPEEYRACLEEDYKSIFGAVKPATNKKSPTTLRAKTSNADAVTIADEFSDLLGVLKNYKDFPEQILEDFSEANEKFDKIIQPLREFNKVSTNFNNKLKQIAEAIYYLADNIENIQILDKTSEYNNLKKKAQDEDKLKKNLQLCIFSKCVEVITRYFEYLISGKNAVDFSTFKIKFVSNNSTSEMDMKDLLDTTSGNIANPNKLKSELEKKFEKEAPGNIKKSVNEKIRYIGRRLIFFGTATERANTYYNEIKLAYAIVFGVTTAKKADDVDNDKVDEYINKKNPQPNGF